MSSYETNSAARSPAIAPPVHIHFSWIMLGLLALLLVVPWLIIAGLLIGRHVAPEVIEALEPKPDANQPALILGKTGPWGQLQYARIMIDPPDEFIFVPPVDRPAICWFFKGYTKDRVTKLFKSAELAPAQLDSLLNKATWKTGPDGAEVTPGDPLILGLSPASRAKIYTVLVEIPENSKQIDPVWFDAELLDEQLKDSGLSEQSIKLLKSLLYQTDSSTLLFADFETALRQLPTDGERRRFVKAVSRKTGLVARLKIDEQSDIESLANYWGVGGRRKDLVPLMNSVRRVEGGWNPNLVYLLPRFMRERLYTYPFPSTDAETNRQDCFWSAFNAFSEQPDNRFFDMQYVRQVLQKDYYTILEPSRLGDMVFLATRDDTVIHAAVYLADDVVFTKNGIHFSQPWMLMHESDMIKTYSARYPSSCPLKVLYFRKKSL